MFDLRQKNENSQPMESSKFLKRKNYVNRSVDNLKATKGL